MQSWLKKSIILFVISLSAMAEESGEVQGAGTWWINLAAGASTVVGYESKSEDDHADDGSSSNSPMVAASFNYAIFDHQFIEFRATANTSYNSEFLSCFLGCQASEEKLNSIYDAGILYGLMAKTKYLTITGSVGLAYTGVEYEQKTVTEVDGIEESNRTHSTVSTIGVPVEMSVFFTPSRYFGIGFMVMANGNTEASYVGGLLGIQFGKLR